MNQKLQIDTKSNGCGLGGDAAALPAVEKTVP
jgi:hypothetical protein